MTTSPPGENALKLSVHHIGGRDGSRGFPSLGLLEQDVVNVLYDADPDCLQQIRQRNVTQRSKVHVLPYCVSDACRKATFTIHYDPFTSSLKSLNPAYGAYYFVRGDHDYVLSEAMRPLEQREVDLVTLDSIFSSDSHRIPPPDFLSLDTEGAEYEILTGAQQLLRDHLLALVVEVAFHPVTDQRLFGEITALLAQQGFLFVKFLSHHPSFAPVRGPLGLRGEGVQLKSDALYLKRLDVLQGTDDAMYLMDRKLAFIALVFNQVEYALKVLQHSRTLRHQTLLDVWMNSHQLYRFLNEFEAQAQQMPQRFPQTFADKYTAEASRARFQVKTSGTAVIIKAPRSEAFRTRIASWLRRYPTLFWNLREMRNQVVRIQRLLKACLAWRPLYHLSGVEAVLVKYGLITQAELVRRQRISQEIGTQRS